MKADPFAESDLQRLVVVPSPRARDIRHGYERLGVEAGDPRVDEARDSHADGVRHVARIEGLCVRRHEKLERAFGVGRGNAAMAAERFDQEDEEDGEPQEEAESRAGLLRRDGSS